MSEIDVVLEITFDINKPDKSVIRTNAKESAIKEILFAWLLSKVKQCEDKSKPNSKNLYKIKIWLNLSNDTFPTSSDTGNEDMTYGIVLTVLERLSEIEVIDL